jgi:hypothetical protein
MARTSGFVPLPEDGSAGPGIGAVGSHEHPNRLIRVAVEPSSAERLVLAGEHGFVHGNGEDQVSLLALHAAARGLAIGGMALLEPPIDANEDPTAQTAFTAELSRRVAAGHPDDAVEYFLTSCGVPDEIVTGMRADGAWSAMEKIAHTLVYDAMISEAITRPLLASVTVPTLVLDSQGSPDDLTGMAATVAAWLPNSSHQSLAGAWHGVADDVLAPVLTAFFRR